MQVIFENVTITITAPGDNPSVAYDLLCSGLASLERKCDVQCDWDTTTYTMRDDSQPSEPIVRTGLTDELFPDD